ncbi:hypothetical protein BGZ61DRAFT_467407 [Ilyonectria robusta]|uniref:uncharacterized protein n=1 Tax=Ilyonectria robusta TaxID=1079257 RepID=UPI001E8EBA8D|nr:uncharacterized protein BGZ61DRAFT_467407 [Ilyonectria robusta]KAH8654767.1 hypothetical protein BGZ61DRAFT_467407 [Ilyonectria robusta]
MAVSRDGGNTWNKSNENSILSGEPDDVEVWGFRDPFLSEWPALDQLRGQKSLYGLVSGGVHSMGPRVFLYAVSPVDLGAWHYLGPVIDFPIRYCPSLKWGADFGANLECANVMTLEDGSGERSFLVGQMAQLLLVPGRPNSGEFALGLIEPGTLPLRADGQNDCLLMPMTRLGHDIFIKRNRLVRTA